MTLTTTQYDYDYDNGNTTMPLQRCHKGDDDNYDDNKDDV
jgi:hypothetical protein